MERFDNCGCRCVKEELTTLYNEKMTDRLNEAHKHCYKQHYFIITYFDDI